MQPLKLSTVIFFLVVFSTACAPTPGSLEQVTTVPAGVAILNVSESQTVSREITQYKTFNQCDSASSFKAEVRFSNTSDQENQQELVLMAALGGEAGISEVAKITLEGAIEQHFLSSSSNSQGHQESVTIDIPSRTQQEYTIIWRENRREGSIQYTENGETKSANYSNRIGLELMSATGKDLICPSQISVAEELTPSDTTSPAFTPQPIIADNPQDVKSSDTPAGTILEIGQSWRTDNLILTLGEIQLYPQPEWEFCYVSLKFSFENMSAVDRSITIKESQFNVADNLGRNNIQHSISSYTYPCPPRNEPSFSQLVKAGDRFPHEGYWYVGISSDITNSSLEYLIVTINGLSSFNGASWKIPIYH